MNDTKTHNPPSGPGACSAYMRCPLPSGRDSIKDLLALVDQCKACRVESCNAKGV